MQLLVLQSLQRTARLLHPAHAVPTLGHSFLRAQRTDRFAPGALFFSFRVLFAFTSLVTVEGLTPASRAIFRAESPLRMPSSMITLLSLSMCFLLPSLIAVSLPAGASSSKRDARGKRGQDGCGIRPAPNFFCGRCTTWCNRIAFRNSIHETSAFSSGERLVEEALCRHHALQGIVQDAVLACKVEADVAALRMLEEVGGRNARHTDTACKLEREAGV